MTKAIVNQEMLYCGEQRYKGEVITMHGARNDDALVRVHHLRPLDGEYNMSTIVRDDSGREFVDEYARQQYREKAPREALVIKRGPGRPRKNAVAS